MSYLTVIAKVVAKKNAVEALKVELLKLVEPTREEDGCIEYRLHQDEEDPSIFVFYETWQSRESLSQHMQSPHFMQYIQNTSSLIADKNIHLMAELNAIFIADE